MEPQAASMRSWKGIGEGSSHSLSARQVMCSPQADGMVSRGSGMSGAGELLVSGPGQLLKFSPDGRRLGFTDGDRMGIWEVEQGQECRLLQPRSEMTEAWHGYRGHESIAYSPDGRLLASAGGDGIRVWDTASALELTHLDIGYHEAVLFHPSHEPPVHLRQNRPEELANRA